MQGKKMEIYKIGLDKRGQSPIIRQADRRQHKSVLFPCAQFYNARSRGALCPRFSRGRGASFCVFGKGVSEACIAMKPARRW